MIRILIVDDSETETKILKSLFEGEKDFQIVGYAKNGRQGVLLTEQLKPDLITMDVQMPVMDGLEATRLIMAEHPTPIVVISSIVKDESLNITFRALEAGAISVLSKLVLSSPDYSKERKAMIDTVRSMAEIKVVKRRFHTPGKHTKMTLQPDLQISKGHYEIIAIGASVGGPQALKALLSALPVNFPIPIVIVQHMSKGFMSGFTKWLDASTEIKVKNAEHNEILKPGTVYFAPDNSHLKITRIKDQLTAHLLQSAAISGFCPSITALFESIATVCGQNSIGILLTGMGHDGAKGLLKLKQAEAHTLIQDKNSSIVFGMAGVAESMGAVDKVIALEQIADYLMMITRKGREHA